ncbi:MAG: GNAT family N-acetyltransferase [Alphaproteobacteria bacterium]
MVPDLIRPARDEDAEGLIALIGACWAEYDGCILDVDGEVPELRAIASYFGGNGGRFWIGEAAGRLVASVGFLPSGAGLELCKLYVDRSQRRSGLGRRLVGLVETVAVERRLPFVELWSDTRFGDAHRLYERLGYERRATRAVDDISRTVEYHYRKTLAAPDGPRAIA